MRILCKAKVINREYNHLIKCRIELDQMLGQNADLEILINNKQIAMNKVLIVLMALLAFASADFLRTHDYWYTAQKSIVKTGAPLSDLAWNYCDLKCLYLERYYPTADFAFITFNAGTFKPNFGACYVIKTEVTGAKSYALWNTVATNAWYDTNCGKETEDYYALSTGTSAKYKVEQIEGEGRGNEVTY